MKKMDEEDTHIKYEYLIWKAGVGFMHTDNFSDDKLEVFLDDLKDLIEKRSIDTKDHDETEIIPMD
jgi:hypothetical protein|tara:strand:- start:2179 stop:2376 length:198 start_codon:yes stop_codon:yes gene_type:complete